MHIWQFLQDIFQETWPCILWKVIYQSFILYSLSQPCGKHSNTIWQRTWIWCFKCLQHAKQTMLMLNTLWKTFNQLFNMHLSVIKILSYKKVVSCAWKMASFFSFVISCDVEIFMECSNVTCTRDFLFYDTKLQRKIIVVWSKVAFLRQLSKETMVYCFTLECLYVCP